MRAAFLLAALAMLLLPLPLAAQAPACRVLILTGSSDLPHHQWRETAPQLANTLREQTRCQVTVHEKPETLMPEMLRAHTTLLLDYNGPRFPARLEKAIEDFVRAGGGFVAFHLCLYGTFYGMELTPQGKWQTGSTAGWAAYPQLIGASWKAENIGHSLRHVFTVQPRDPLIAAPFMADDELYHRFDLLPAARVLATAYSDPAQRGTGRDEPMVWSHTYGRGRTLFTTLGHDIKALAQPGVAALFARAVEWTSAASRKE